MSHQLTHAEVENKMAFLVQLNALLTQIGAVVSSNALGSAQKAKLSDLRTSTEAWLKDVGVVGAPRPSLATPSPPPLPPPAPAPAQAAPPPQQQHHPTPEAPAETAEAAEADAPPLTEAPPSTVAEEAPTTAPSDEAAAAKAVEDAPAAVPASAPPPAPATPLSPSSSLPAELSAALELPEGRGLVDLVAYLRQLFDSDVPERAKLQAFGKNLVRLLMVRCCSTTMASLQHVVHHTYAATAAAAAVGDASDTDSCAEAAITEPTALAKLFVVLAKEINVATRALLGCVHLVTASAVLSDAATVRFPLQLCVDVVRQTRRAQVYFQSRVEKEELYLLRTQLLSSGTALTAAAATTARDRDASLEDLDAAQEAALQTSPDRLAAHVRGRLKALQQLWGPSLVHAIRNIGGVVEPAVKFLASVAAVRAEGAPAPLVALKKDAAHDLFSLCGPMTAAAAANGSSNGSGVAKTPSSGDLTAAAPPAGSPASVCSATPPAWRAAAGEVLTRLGCSFSADYLAAVAGCCGDSNEGQLLATRLLTDMLQYVATHELSLLRCLLRHSRWHRPLYDGILNCLVSIQPAVLAAGLDALGLLTTACPMEVGQEVGFLYSNVVLRLLESTNSPHYVKRTIVLHFLTTFMSTTSTVDVEGGNAGAAVPLLLHLYRLYDLNVHVHQLNFAQQLTGALSRIVRAAPKEDFTQDAVVQEQLRLQQEAAAATATTAAGSAGAAGEAQRRGSGAEGGASSEPSTSSTGAAVVPNLSSLSLPAMALHGLVRIVELLTTQTPPEEEGGRDVLATLPAMTCREDKLREQQAVDRFNAAPKKALLKLLDVTEAENAVPESHAGFTAQWEHTLLPPPLSAATAAKIEAAADLLSRTSSLHPEAVAEFLTTPAVFPLQVCAAYMRRLPLAGYTVLEAISELLMRVQLPKEGQRIERLLEYFSAAYYAANRGPGIDRDVFPFKSDTAVFIVIVATVMLNTNIHNPSAGMRLDLKAFRGQLRRCNEDENFADSFVDHIFDRISTRPLESIKAIAPDPTTTASGAGGDGATSRGAFDIFFVSQEEKRQLAFGAERQRMVSETRQLLQLRTEQVPPAAVAAAWWCAAAKDFFLSTWSAVCAVFGPAMYEGATAAPMDVLLQCVRGLQSLLCTAAAFDLPTECTVTLLTLLRMAEATPVRAHCRRAVLVVATTTHAINFPVRCWVAVCQLVLELRRTATAAAPPLVENVFTRIEGITRLSVEAGEERVAAAAAAANATTAASTATEGAAGPDRCTQAIHRALEGIMTTISGYAVGDVANLGAALAVLRRALEYTRIVHLKRTTDIVYFVNVRDFTDVVVPAYVELLQKHSASDEGLQVLFECLVDLLCAMWVSYSTRRVVPPSSAAAATAAPAPSLAVTVDTAPAGFAQCFECLRRVYDATLASAGDGAATLLQMHTLQAVKEVLSRSVRAAEVTSAGQHLSLYTMVASWRAALYPLAMALCDRASTATEAASLALLVLRKLVALCGGTGGASSDRLPAPVRGALLWLLAQLAYMGGMCGDVDSAQVCVALLSSICTSTVAMAASAAGPAARGWHTTDGIASPAVAFADSGTFARLMEGRDALTQQVVASIEETPNFVVQRTLMRLCLLLRCEREQTRAEVVHQLRTLALQMQPQQLCPMALDLAEVVLEGTIGHAAHHHKTPITHPSLMPFLFFRMPVPPSMRRCSRSAFRATVPATLSFLANELLTGLTGDHLATAAESVMRRCLMPILLSPNSPYQCRFIAVRSLSQCIAVCLPQTAAAPSPRLAQCVLDCLAMALSAVQVPLPNIVSPAAGFVGRRWLDPPSPSGAAPWARYGAQAAKTVALMDTAEPQWLVRGASAAAAATAWGLPVPPQDDGGAVAAGPAPSRSGRGGAGGGGAVGSLLADEPLIEYISLLAQILAGVPRELHGVVTKAAAAAPAEAAPPTAAGAEEEDWTLPHASVRVLLQLCLQAAGTLFAVLWRINHPYEVEQYALQSVQLGREPATYARNGGLLPHAAIRSVLQCYLELAMLCPEYPSSDLLAVTTDLIEGIRQVQVVAHPGTPGPASPSLAAGPTAAAGSGTSLASDSAALQRLPPQEQQHVRTCNSGMHQQLATVLGYLVRLLTGQPPAAATAAGVAAIDGGATAALSEVLPGWTRRQEAFEAMALHPHFFSSLVSLLTPTAGTLIVTVRDYFAWYIAHAVVPQSAVQAAGCSTSGDDAITSAAAVALDEAEVGEETGADALIAVKGGGHDCSGHANGSGNGLSRADASKREQARAALAPLLKPASLGDEPERFAAPHDADVVAHAKVHNGSAAAELEEVDSLL